MKKHKKTVPKYTIRFAKTASPTDFDHAMEQYPKFAITTLMKVITKLIFGLLFPETSSTNNKKDSTNAIK